MAANDIHETIDALVKEHDVVLFMKGNRTFPQCGFSATVVQILDELVEDYETVNVLSDPDLRSGIKTYSDWPTIPQLYVKGEFLGGCDIVRQLYSRGELQKKLGVPLEEVSAPRVQVTDAAAEVLSQAAAQEGHDAIRFQVGANFQYGLSFAKRGDGDLVVEANGVTLLFDRGSAKRADGIVVDYNEALGGFRIDNPNEPPAVRTVSVEELKALLDSEPSLRLIDVRSADERAIATIPGSVQLTEALQQELLALPKDTPLFFSCHHGGRSQRAAEEFLRAGFTNVHNVHGGVDAWSTAIDPTVPRY